jgi:predicted site-specific integrase-resolvase
MGHLMPRLLTLQEVAKAENVKPRVVRYWIAKGAVRAVRTPKGHRRVPVLDAASPSRCFLTYAEAADFFRVDVRTIRSWIADGDLTIAHTAYGLRIPAAACVVVGDAPAKTGKTDNPTLARRLAPASV